MNTYNNDTHICNCNNQAIQAEGSICDVCMGTVGSGCGSAVSHQPAMLEVFDESYFEALESFYEDITYAA